MTDVAGNEPSRLDVIKERARILRFDLWMLTSAAGGTALGGFLGHKLGRTMAPEASSIPAEIWQKTVELAPTLGAAAIGGVLGFVGAIVLYENIEEDNF